MKKKSATTNIAPRASVNSPSQLLVDIAFERIEQMIITRKLPPGSMISESQLAAEMDMGRTPVREALQRLRQIGFVEMLPRRGTLVAGVDIRQQLELLEVRRALEDLVVRVAALRATPEERENLKRLAQQMTIAAKRGDMEAWIQAGGEIHDAEVRATHNSMLITSMLPIHAQSRRFWYHHIVQNRAYIEGAQLHSKVLTAIADGDGDRAAAAAHGLMQFIERFTRSALDTF
ncbi:GntR family transcriptional regulator [Paraburkholderia antibiotica]|uniref:GntR family transcriptional regulator n=1 Tax=Paraburkholderia antibiotica TaxID=2728839 RepID=A0A7X9X5K1_9BURK|nr:GntR family transcriptional regulator [Paraburkholderia antibiotica]NML31820.1 GntR family transcriptional regulator [Paraburkholderia antibiotica]